MSKADEIIDKIQSVRGENNKNWMDLLRLAYRAAPEEARNIMAKIGFCDLRINSLTRELTELEDGK